MILLRATATELEGYLGAPVLLHKRLQEQADMRRYDIDKSWEGIIYLLTGDNASGKSHPFAFLLFSGQLIAGTPDAGYGPAHYHNPEQAKRFHEMLDPVSPDSLRSGFDPDRMLQIGIYPNAWTYPGTLDYLIEYYESVREAFAAAAAQGEAVITLLRPEEE